MKIQKKVRDIMIPLSEYPHIPYWLTLRQAMGVIRKICIKYKGAYYEPGTMLVFDQQYRLLGILRRRELLRALQSPMKAQKGENNEKKPWAGLFERFSKEDAQKPVSEAMTPIKVIVGSGDSIEKAAYLMLKHDVGLLPVMSDEKVEGVVRMTDLFNEIIEIFLTE